MLRIKEIELANLHPWEDNPRINDHAVEAVAKSISSFGFNVPIICDQNHIIVAGHTRWKAAQKLGMSRIPVIIIELTDAQRKAFAVADNKTAEIADWDFPRLQEILNELRGEDIQLSTLGYSDNELHALLVPEKDFNWEEFEDRLRGEQGSKYVLLPVKVPRPEKDAVKKAIESYACKHNLDEKDSAILAGKVFHHLLGESK